jgi:hypothetical protein
MAHAQKPDFVFRRNGRVHLNRRGASVQSTTGSRGVRISGSNAGYTMFRGSVKGTGYSLHSPVSPSFPLPCVPVCHHISTGLYYTNIPKLLILQYSFPIWHNFPRYRTLHSLTVAYSFQYFAESYHYQSGTRWRRWSRRALQVGRSRVRFPTVSLQFFIGIILPAALWPWGWLNL